jgi:transposase-like protein
VADPVKEITVLHVIGPLGEPKCPSCGSLEVEERGIWDWGPFYWQCEICNKQWGHA